MEIIILTILVIILLLLYFYSNKQVEPTNQNKPTNPDAENRKIRKS